MEARQLAFELGHRPALGADDFLVAPTNAEAVAWIDRWPRWPAPGLAVYGPPGGGKTHLAHVWRARSGALLLPAVGLAGLDLADLARAPRPVAVDGCDGMLAEAALLHLYNLLAENSQYVLLTAREPPSRWAIALPDLRSRLAALPAVAVADPDERLLAALLVKLFADRQIRIESGLVDWLVLRLERSCDAARRAVAALDAAALAHGRPITRALARDVLGDPRAAQEGG